ncbi:MAG: Gldg family protein, partial [Bacteroidota bacterium]
IIDQFIMRGGKALFFLDKLAIDMDSISTTSTTIALPYNLNLDDQLFRYGVRLNSDLLLDMKSAPIPVVTGYTGNTPRQELVPGPYFPLLDPADGNPVSNNLNVVKGEFCGTIDTIEVSGIRKTVLLSGSKACRIQMAPARVSLNILQEEPDERDYNKLFLPTAVLLEGTFSSNFRNRIPETIRDSKEIGFMETGKATKLIVVADGDVIRNHVSKKGAIYPLGYDRFTNQSYGNLSFVLNCVDYLCDDSGVIGLRSKEFKLRLLDGARMNELPWIPWLNVLAPLLMVVITGIIYNRSRKKKYS